MSARTAQCDQPGQFGFYAHSQSMSGRLVSTRDVAIPVMFSLRDQTIVENQGTATITVRHLGDGDRSSTVKYATMDGSAQAGSDYSSTSGTVTWQAGDTSDQTFRVPILDDLMSENTETFKVSLTDPDSGDTLDTATVTILDDDDPQAPFAVTDVTVYENAGAALIDVKRADSSGTLTLSYAMTDGTAQAGSDYSSTSGTFTFADGESEKTITVLITEDLTPENTETFTVTLSDGTNERTATVTILDDDDSGTPQFAANNVEVAENVASGTVTITVERTGGEALTLDYATRDGTAKDGSDYVGATGKLVWQDGDTQPETITITIIDDSKSEGPETFLLDLYESGSDTPLNTVTVTIQDDDTTLVTLDHFTATALGSGGIKLKWKTDTELDSAGFRIWRAPDERWRDGDYSTVIKLTDQLIPAEGESGGGATYDYIDEEVESGLTYYYALQEIDLNGKSTFYLDHVDFATAK